jgi:tetratricopeptide (TPR) repeat protein
VVISAIGGTAGVGKTALALHWAHRVAPLFPDGQLYVDLQGFDPGRAPLAPADAIRSFLCALGMPHEAVPANQAAQLGLYRSLLADRSVLIVLDNARDAEQVRPLLPSSPRCLTVVTSRNQLTGLAAANGASLLTLDVLTEDEAGELLERHLGALRMAAEPGAVTDLIRLCARLPLALSIAAAHVAANPGLPLTDLAHELAKARLDTLATQDAATDIRAAFSWTYQNLSPAAARMFRLLGVHPGPDITAAAAASLAGVAPDEARAAVAELTGAHLLARRGAGRFACHDLLQAYAAERAEADEDGPGRRAAVRRILDHYLHTAHAADQVLDPQRGPAPLGAQAAGVTPETVTSLDAAQAWFEAEQRVMHSATALAARAGFGTHAWQLARAQATYFIRHGDWHAWVDVLRIALAAARQAGDRAGQARAGFDLGRAMLRLGRYPAARAQLCNALILFGALGDRAGQAHTHIELGRAFRAQGDLAMALDYAGTALVLAEAAGNRAMWAGALNNIGYYHAYRGEHEAALLHCQRALRVFRELGSRNGAAHTLDSLGYAYYLAGEDGKATACFREALDLLRELGSRSDQATVLSHWGDALAAAGQHQHARDAWQQALDILDSLHDPDAGVVRAKLRGGLRSG